MADGVTLHKEKCVYTTVSLRVFMHVLLKYPPAPAPAMGWGGENILE